MVYMRNFLLELKGEEPGEDYVDYAEEEEDKTERKNEAKDGSKEVTRDDDVIPNECALLVKKHCWCPINPDDSVSTNKTEEEGGDYNNEDRESGVKASGQDSGEEFSGKFNISDNTDRLMGTN